MFILLLIGNLVLSLVVCFFVIRVFRRSVAAILGRIIKEDISSSWVRYIVFATYVAGISSGVRVWDLEQYLAKVPPGEGAVALVLNAERLVFESYRTLIGTLQGISGVLLAFFVVAIIAYAVVRAVEDRRDKAGTTSAK